jgi:2-iminobutanoate/2-iminopropanoate deaminase
MARAKTFRRARMASAEMIQVPGVGNPQWYSGASRFGDLIWTAGQVPVRADGTVPEDFSEQVHLMFDNLEKTLEAAGSGLGSLLKTMVFLASLDDFDAYNAVYVERMAGHPLPPRSTVEVTRFRRGMRIELEAVAHRA